jgi:hypothetical protein
MTNTNISAADSNATEQPGTVKFRLMSAIVLDTDGNIDLELSTRKFQAFITQNYDKVLYMKQNAGASSSSLDEATAGKIHDLALEIWDGNPKLVAERSDRLATNLLKAYKADGGDTPDGMDDFEFRDVIAAWVSENCSPLNPTEKNLKTEGYNPESLFVSVKGAGTGGIFPRHYSARYAPKSAKR